MLAGKLPPLTLYVHFPWCVRKCPYCDFNSHAQREPIPQAEYLAALRADLRQDLNWTAGRRFDSVFFGGGTPSLFDAEFVHRLLVDLADLDLLAERCEITLEANPGSVETTRFRAYRAAGVNRLSIGVQSFDDDSLKRLGRIHCGDEARIAAQSVHRAGFESFNLDLMWGLPEQSVAQAVADVEVALALAPDHISHYQLTIEPNTLFMRYPPALPGEEALWKMQQACAERLTAGAYNRYEVSAWNKPDAECRHNLNYWQFGDYLGIGAGAHSKLTSSQGEVYRRVKIKHPSAFLAALGQGNFVQSVHRVDVGDLGFEFMLNALRLSAGVPRALFAARTGLSLAVLAPQLANASAQGLLINDPERLCASELGQRFLDDLVAHFLPATGASRDSSPVL